MRDLAVEFASASNPGLSVSQLQDIADALNGSPEKTPGCNVTVPAAIKAKHRSTRFPSFALPKARASSSTFYADPVNGKDSNPGTFAAPFQTIGRAVNASRSAPSPSGNSIILRAGTFYMPEPIVLTTQDSYLSIQSYTGEEAWLSRGTPITSANWQPYNTSGGGWQVFQNQNAVYGGTPTPGKFAINGTYNNWEDCQAACQANYTAGGPCTIWTWHDDNNPGYNLECWFREDGQWAPTPEADHVSGYMSPQKNIYVANLASYGFSTINGLRADGLRMIRARYPNANPEFGFGSNLNANGWVGPNQPIQPDIEYRPAVPFRNTSDQFQYFTLGIGGICAQEGFGFDPPLGYWCSNITEYVH
jgi:hypothetical protein